MYPAMISTSPKTASRPAAAGRRWSRTGRTPRPTRDRASTVPATRRDAPTRGQGRTRRPWSPSRPGPTRPRVRQPGARTLLAGWVRGREHRHAPAARGTLGRSGWPQCRRRRHASISPSSAGRRPRPQDDHQADQAPQPTRREDQVHHVGRDGRPGRRGRPGMAEQHEGAGRPEGGVEGQALRGRCAGRACTDQRQPARPTSWTALSAPSPPERRRGPGWSTRATPRRRSPGPAAPRR